MKHFERKPKRRGNAHHQRLIRDATPQNRVLEAVVPISNISAIERISLVLVGQHLNLNGTGDESSVGEKVDIFWVDYQEDAIAILKLLREPDPQMSAAGDVGTWEAMVRSVRASHES